MGEAKPSRWAMVAWALAVFVLAVCLRLPSCYESFWLDELHTAWAIWDDLADVGPRAEVGNQTPLYFQLMWFWKQVVGESEVALRLSSVFATALASALLVVGLTRTTGRLACGVLAGAILSIESNSIFFGTEFRPYAWVMLCAVIAVWAGVELVSQQSDRSTLLHIIFVSAASLAGLLHPTSIVAFGMLAGVLAAIGAFTWLCTPDRRMQFAVGDLIWMMILAATVFALFHSSLSNSWERRDNWRAFGVARSTWQLWTIWPWTAIAILPVALGAVTAWRKPPREVLVALLPLFVAVVVTSVFFVASYYDLVPLWHRRYFVAALPMLAWSAGALPMMGLPARIRWETAVIGPFIVVAIVGFLMHCQGTTSQLWEGNTKLVTRGEDWRGALSWLREHKKDEEPVLLDSGLIEARMLDQIPTRSMLGEALSFEQYLTFPVRGPYQVSSVFVDSPSATSGAPVGFILEALRESLRENSVTAPVGIEKSGRTWVVSRSSRQRIALWCQRISNNKDAKPIYRQFGSIYVVHFMMLAKPHDGLPELDFPLGRGIN